MPAYRPVVDVAGFRRVLSPRDGLAGAVVVYAASNVGLASFVVGNALAAAGGGLVQALAVGLSLPCLGLAVAVAGPGEAAVAQLAGALTLPDWTAVTGAASLSPGSVYFLDPATAGALSLTPPATAGQALQAVGLAVTGDTLLIDVQPPILRG